MSYYRALGAVPEGTYAPGTRWAVGYQVTGLPADQAPGAVQRLRDTVAYGWRGRLAEVGWGPRHGVPSGHLFALLETGASLPAGELNRVAANMGANLQTRLPGTTVRNTHAHIISTPSSGSTMQPPAPPAPPAFPGMPGMPGTSTMPPAYDPYATMMPAEPGGLSTSIGGIPLWLLLAGSATLIGGFAYMATRPTPRPVAANRRRARRSRGRRVRRNQTRYVVVPNQTRYVVAR